jgi:hypothetical protein
VEHQVPDRVALVVTAPPELLVAELFDAGSDLGWKNLGYPTPQSGEGDLIEIYWA